MTLAHASAQAAPPAFNLIDEPWVPVLRADGRRTDLSLMQLFEQATDIVGLAEPSPPAFVALHRLLLAITHRALSQHLGRWTDSDRARWWQQGWPSEAFTQYFHRWHHRFWLFHPEQPFMQVAALAEAPQTLASKPWTQVSLERAGGNNPVLFDHSLDDSPFAVTASTVLRALLGYLQFAAAGPVKVLRKDGFGRKGALFDSAAILPMGSHLQRTLLLGLHPAPLDGAEDAPSWERATLGVQDLALAPSLHTGPNDRYTRQVRAALLLRTPQGTVARLRFCEGVDLLGDELAADPMNAHRQADDKRIRLRFTDSRSLWRDLPGLLPSPDGMRWHPAPTMVWAQNLFLSLGAWDAAMEVTVAGMAANQGKMLDARLERFRLPSGLMTANETAAALSVELHRCEDLYAGLRVKASAMLASVLPQPSGLEARRRGRTMFDGGPSGRVFFGCAERGLAAVLQHLGQGLVEAAHKSWTVSLLDAARQAWQAASDCMGPSAAAIRARARGEGVFLNLIGPLLAEQGTECEPPNSIQLEAKP